MEDKLKCPECGRRAVYSRLNGTRRCNQCNWEGSAMKQEKSVPAEIPDDKGETVTA